MLLHRRAVSRLDDSHLIMGIWQPLRRRSLIIDCISPELFISLYMTIFDDYAGHKGRYTISPTLLWEYDLTHFDWQRSRKIVVQRVIERGWLRDYFAAFDLYGGIEGFREIIKEVPTLSAQDMNFVCTAFSLKKEELRCYSRRQLRSAT